MTAVAMNVTMNTYSAFDLSQVGTPTLTVIGIAVWLIFIVSLYYFKGFWARVVKGLTLAVCLAFVALILYVVGLMVLPLFEVTGAVAVNMTWLGWVCLGFVLALLYVLGGAYDRILEFIGLAPEKEEVKA